MIEVTEAEQFSHRRQVCLQRTVVDLDGPATPSAPQGMTVAGAPATAIYPLAGGYP